METLKTVALIIHIIGGSVALLTGLFNMIARKGGERHRKAGGLFAWSMYAVALSALVLSVPIGSTFFFCLGVFTFYLTWNGQRSAAQKAVVFDPIDRAILAIGSINTLAMLLLGNAILFGLGILSATLVVREIILFFKVRKGAMLPPNTWLVRHIGMMVGSYISTLTAFLVVNWDGIGPYWIPWALPPSVLVPYIIWWSRKVPGRRRSPGKVVTAAALLLPLISIGQPYVDGGNTRHRFAQMNMGADLHMIPSSGAIGNEEFNSSNSARMLIGGTHFWGHADFVLAIPLMHSSAAEVTEGVETIIKGYPWRIRDERIRPYAGGSWAVFNTRIGDGVVMERMRIPLLAGFTYVKGRSLIDACVRYVIPRHDAYWTSIDVSKNVTLPPWSFSIGLKFMFDTTLSAERNFSNGRTQALIDTLVSTGGLKGLTIAIGAGTAFFLHRSRSMHGTIPYMDGHRISRPYVHGRIGYYIHQPDMQLSLSYRQIVDRLNAFGHEQEFQRRSLSLEAYHFFADLHGFVPFVGSSISHEELLIDYTDGEKNVHSAAKTIIRPGILAGWDIRPDRLRSFLLRTQLRYVIGDALRANGMSTRTDQLEVDFIQLVVFPGRAF